MRSDLLEFHAMQNIAEELDLDLEKIGAEVVDGYDADLRSRQAWDAEMKEAMDLALQIREKKNFPWEGASNVKMPLMTEAALQYNSMMYPALVPSVNIVKTRIVGEDKNGQKQESAIRVGKHMSYQVLEEMESWEEEMDMGLMVQPILGNMYKKTYWDNGKTRPASELLTPNDFVVNYNAKSIETAFRKTHIVPLNKNDVRKEELAGNFIEQDYGDPVQEDKKRHGENPPVADQSTEYKFLEQHTYLDLDEDGLMEPYIVTVEQKSKKVARIVSGYDPDQIIENADGEVIDVPQLQYFTKYGFVPNPDGGILDLGLGKLLGPTNEAVNTLINQLIDAGTKSNMGGGFIGKGLRIKGGKLRFSMGEYKRVDAAGVDLARNIVHLPTNEPSNVLFQLLGLLINAGQRLSSTLDSQVGENPGQNQKATTTAIVEQNGQKIFNGIYKRCLRSLGKEFKKIFYLNSKNLSDEQYLNVLDGGYPPNMAQTIRRIDYNVGAVNIVPAADSSYQSQQQKYLKAQALMQKIGTGLINPMVAMKAMLEAEEQPNIDQLMQVPKGPPPLEEREFTLKQQLEQAKLKLEALRIQQDDITTRTNAVLALAKAESLERGDNVKEYLAQLEALISQSKRIGQSASSVGNPPQGGDEGMEGPEGNEMGESES